MRTPMRRGGPSPFAPVPPGRTARQHGVARSFDEDVTSSGYALAHLDIPRRADGSSRYEGPSGSTKLLEQGVECTDDSTVVFHLAEPVGNFDEVVSLPEFAPYKTAKGGRDRGTHRLRVRPRLGGVSGPPLRWSLDLRWQGLRPSPAGSSV